MLNARGEKGKFILQLPARLIIYRYRPIAHDVTAPVTMHLACEQALWIELEPAGFVNKNTSVPITIYSVNCLASFAGISPEESGGGLKTHSQAKTHREACGGG